MKKTNAEKTLIAVLLVFGVSLVVYTFFNLEADATIVAGNPQYIEVADYAFCNTVGSTTPGGFTWVNRKYAESSTSTRADAKTQVVSGDRYFVECHTQTASVSAIIAYPVGSTTTIAGGSSTNATLVGTAGREMPSFCANESFASSNCSNGPSSNTSTIYMYATGNSALTCCWQKLRTAGSW